jgi:Conjugal transfer protein
VGECGVGSCGNNGRGGAVAKAVATAIARAGSGAIGARASSGRQTFITFPETLGSTEAPPLFVLSETGEAQLVNWRKQGNVYVVDRLFDRAELRLGGERPGERSRVVRIERKGDRDD